MKGKLEGWGVGRRGHLNDDDYIAPHVSPVHSAIAKATIYLSNTYKCVIRTAIHPEWLAPAE